MSVWNTSLAWYSERISILSALAAHPEGLYGRELVAQKVCGPTVIYLHLGALEELYYVSRSLHEAGPLYHITPKGRDALAQKSQISFGPTRYIEPKSFFRRFKDFITR